MSELIKLKHIGNGYSGFDPGTNQPITVAPGEIVEVSDAKAEQLLADFPEEWKEVKPAAAKTLSKRKL